MSTSDKMIVGSMATKRTIFISYQGRAFMIDIRPFGPGKRNPGALAEFCHERDSVRIPSSWGTPRLWQMTSFG